MRFWVSFETRSEDDYRPVLVPVPGVPHWWRSSDGDGYVIICAVVDADDKEAAMAEIRVGWPEYIIFSFCNAVADDWLPTGGRFPVREPYAYAKVGTREVEA